MGQNVHSPRADNRSPGEAANKYDGRYVILANSANVLTPSSD